MVIVLAALSLGGLTAGLVGKGLARGVLPPMILEPGSATRPARVGIDSSAPAEPVTILFFQGRPSAPMSDGRRVVVAEGGQVVAGRDRPRLTPIPMGEFGGAIQGAAPAGASGGWWLSLLDGSLVRLRPDRSIATRTSGPFGATYLWPAAKSGAFAVRSPERFTFGLEADGTPLIAVIDSAGSIRPEGGSTTVPDHVLLTTLANAGFLAASGDTVYFAPLSRSEILAFGPGGDTLWRSLPTSSGPATPSPRFRVNAGKVSIDYQPFNLGLTIGPDGRLYRLRAADTAMQRTRIDVIDRASGVTLAVADLATVRANLAVNAKGRLYRFREGEALGAVDPAWRDPFPAFDLPLRGGGTTSLGALRGRVVLVNFWASWCGPCRTEMPALDSLQARLSGNGFAFLGLNADADRRDAAAFADRFGFTFPIGYGGPDLEARYHYPGLPFTVLLDPAGRVIRRWIGQLSQADLGAIAMLVESERPRPAGVPEGHHHTPTGETR